MDWSLKDDGYDWAQRFDEDAKATLLEDPGNITELAGHRDYAHAVPTPDHFLPMLYLAGLAGASPSGVQVMVDGYAYGSLSMTAYTVGMERQQVDGTGFAAKLPDGPPPDGANI